MKPIYLILLISCLPFISKAQNTGDTIVVNALNYQSISRDTMVAFPNNPNLSFERVIMRYAMRCKDGLVSPPITGQTNRGCGEWDYSCNTYITDSTKADSISRTIDRYQVIPNTNTSGIYSATPTWSGRPIVQQQVYLQTVLLEDTAVIGNGNATDSSFFTTDENGGKSFILLTQSELIAAGMTAGDIDAISLDNIGSSSFLKSLKVRVKATTAATMAAPSQATFASFQEVYFHDYALANGLNRIQFHTPFIWDGISNVLFEVTYKGRAGNNPVLLKADIMPNIMSLASSTDFGFNFFPSNYVEANNYKGIQSNNARTVEAWIKTTVRGKEIASWGVNATGQKFSFRTENNGYLRLEINAGYVVGSIDVTDGQWHHIALVFSGTSTANVKFYVDGVLNTTSNVLNIPIITGNSLNFQLSNGFHGRYFDGQIDDVRIWSTNLSASTIQNWSYRKIDASHPNYSDLDLYYPVVSNNSNITDESINGNDGEFKFSPSFSALVGENHFKEFQGNLKRPSISVYQGTYTQTVSNDTVIDTTFLTPFTVIENTVFPKPGTVNSDSIGSITTNLWPKDNILYNLNGTVNSTIPSGNTTTLQNSTLPYFQRNASKLEIMSFVTPYGINLNLGMEGKAWYFDVTDFAPSLIGNKRISLERGGQNQEQMDIQFLFIVGTPVRDVIDIQQIWKVDSRPYAQIISNEFFAPRTIQLNPIASQFKLRSAITGHGQEGEFIPRTHFLNVNNGMANFSRQVWKECSENPIYPQGGTWIYDRAGWCPGMATDVEEIDITSLIIGNTVSVDYGVTSASGTSNYIVNNQLVSYGAPNFTVDARISKIISPNSTAEFERENPMCDNPEIEIENTGSTPITSATITYWINNSTSPLTYNWTGNLAFLQKATISLPITQAFWSSTGQNNTFHAVIGGVNGAADQYVFNDTNRSNFKVPNVFPNSFYVQFYTNNAAQENRYQLKDASGAILFQRSGMSNSTVYRDTFLLGQGCYSFNVIDTDDDGMSFFANNDGNGSIQLRNTNGGVIKTLKADFGGGLVEQFSIATSVGMEEHTLNKSMVIYPNPAKDFIMLETTGIENGIWELIDAKGQRIKTGLLTNNVSLQTQQISISELNRGLYFIRISDDNGNLSKRFVVAE